MNILIRNQQRLIKANTARTARRLRKLLSLLRLQGTEVSVIFVGDGRMRMLNRAYRGADRTTDVLSFPQFSSEDIETELKKRSLKRAPVNRSSSYELPLGDIVINLHRTKRQAHENGAPFGEELDRLLIHGLLHLIGYDHEQGEDAARRMHRKTRELIRKLRQMNRVPRCL